jgi:mannitol-specific phosphotransferase system IIBC component
MEEGRNIPLIIMLSAGSIISIACIIYKFSMLKTLLLVLGALVLFYLIGLIVKRIILSINHDAEERAALLAQEEYEAKQKELAEQEEIATHNRTEADTAGHITFE